MEINQEHVMGRRLIVLIRDCVIKLTFSNRIDTIALTIIITLSCKIAIFGVTILFLRWKVKWLHRRKFLSSKRRYKKICLLKWQLLYGHLWCQGFYIK